MTRTGFRVFGTALFVVLFAAARAGKAQSVTLEIRPRVGDTLTMRMDQVVEMTGTTRGDTARALAMETAVFTRAVPLRQVKEGTVVLGIADSVVMTPRVSGASSRTRQLGGRSLQILIRQDGGVAILESDQDEDLQDFFGQMPAMLPAGPIAVHGNWTREMPVPVRGDDGSGLVRATFTLDSLSIPRETAFISLKGRLSHERTADEKGGRGANGTIAGTIQLNRRLGWITDSKVTIVLESMVRSAASRGKQAASGAMVVRTRIVQHVRATAK